MVVLTLVAYRRRPNSVRCIASGLCLGLAITLRANYLPFAPIALVWVFVFTPSALKTKLAHALLCVSILSVPLLITSARNQVVAGTFTFMPRSGSINLWLGNHPPEMDGVSPWDSCPAPPEGERLRAALLALATAVLCAGLVATMVSNQRFGQIGRGTPTTMLVRQMSTAVVRVDLTEDGNTRRCGLIDSYSDLYPGPGGWWGGPQVREELNHFMLDRYGRLFCDGPGKEKELLSDPPTDWDWTPRG